MKTSPLLPLVALFATTSCASPQPEVEIRALAAPAENYGVADAEAQLALGNVGLALEGFRNVLRDRPSDTRALLGLAHSYDGMGRFDISRKWYETALATAPENAAVLGDFAASLQRQGKLADAAAVRAEIEANSVASAEVEKAVAADSRYPPRQPDTNHVAQWSDAAPVELAAADAPAMIAGRSPAFAIPSVQLATEAGESSDAAVAAPSVTVRLPAPVAITDAPLLVRTKALPEPAVEAAPATEPEPPVAKTASVTVRLPAPKQVVRSITAEHRGSAAAELFHSREQQARPRLERLSLGVVALVTKPRSVWTAEIAKRSTQSVTLRWVPVRPVARLLNAARVQGLAARTRAHLVDKGWRRIEIGDAPAVRQKTVVLYPALRRGTAQRLAAQFGFTQLRQFDGKEIVVLLGRDAAAKKLLRPA